MERGKKIGGNEGLFGESNKRGFNRDCGVVSCTDEFMVRVCRTRTPLGALITSFFTKRDIFSYTQIS